MRIGMTPALESRLRCVDPTARVLVEAHVVVQDASKRTRAEFETADTVTLREHDFPTANLLDANGETTTLTLSTAPAGNALYVAHYGVEITPAIPSTGENVHEVRVAWEIDDGGGFAEQDATIYRFTRHAGDSGHVVAWLHEQMDARVTGLGATDQGRLRITSVTLPSGASFKVHGFNKTTDADPRLSSPPRLNISPAGSANPTPVAGVTYHTGPNLDFPAAGGVGRA